jgi:hypothetical protein
VLARVSLIFDELGKIRIFCSFGLSKVPPWHVCLFFDEQVRAYHKAYYRPENLSIIVTGKVDPLLVLKSIEPIEKKIIAKVALCVTIPSKDV